MSLKSTHMRIHRRRENLMQFAWKVRRRLLASRKFIQGIFGVVAIGMIDATRWSSIWWCQRALERWVYMGVIVIARVALSRDVGRGGHVLDCRGVVDRAEKNNFHWLYCKYSNVWLQVLALPMFLVSTPGSFNFLPLVPTSYP